MQTRRCANGHHWLTREDAPSEPCPQCGGVGTFIGGDATMAALDSPRPLKDQVADEQRDPKDRTINVGVAPTPCEGQGQSFNLTPASPQDFRGQTVDLAPGAAATLDRQVGIQASTISATDGDPPERSDPTNLGSLPAPPANQALTLAAGLKDPPPAEVRSSRTVGDTEPQQSDEVAIKVKVPGYDILSELGRGGMGVVYKARQAGLNRIVALKMILAGGHAGKDPIARFKIEAAAVAHLHHANIVQVYDIGEQDGCPFFSLEFVDGKSLEEQIDGAPQLPRQAANWLATLAEAMFVAHQAGIIHRDLKPANVLLTKDGVPKITDFGLAKRYEEADTGQTRTGAIMGTPSYMAPEQASGKNKQLGPPADIYALGAIFYELLTGRPPFRGESILQTLRQVQKLEPVAPTRLVPSVPRDLETICLKALQKEPAKRYASAGALADDLRRFLAGEPILARPTPVWEMAWKWARRRPDRAALVGVSAAAAIVVFVLVLLNNVQVRRERDAADAARRDTEASEVHAKLRRDEALAAEAKAQREQQRAEHNFQQAQDAVDQMLTRVGAERLANEPRMEKVRRDLLGEALKFYQRFAATEGDTLGIRFKTGLAQQRVGDIQEKLGQTAEAEKAYREAIRYLGKLAKEDGSNPDYRRQLAAAYNNLGLVLQSLGRRPEAEKAYRQSLETKKALAAAYPDKPAYQLDVAHACTNLGNLHLEAGQAADAGQFYQQALDLFTTLAAAHAGEPIYRREAIRTRAQLGTVLVNQARVSEGEKELRQAEREQAEVAARQPANADAHKDLAQMRFNLAALLQTSKRPVEAEKLYHAAQEMLTRLVEEHPNVVEYRQLLADCANNLGALLRSLTRPRDAEPVWREAVKLLTQLAEEFPRDPSYRRRLGAARDELAMALAGIGRTADAEAEWREAGLDLARLVDKYPRDLSSWHTLVANRTNYCTLLAALGRSDDEIKGRRELIALLDKLAAAFPELPDHASWLGRARHDLAVVLFEGSKLTEAAKCLRDAIRDEQRAVAAVPNQPAFRQQLAGHYVGLLQVLLRQGDHAAIALCAQELTRAVPTGKIDLVQTAGTLAQCVALADKDDKLSPEKRKELAQAYAAQAVALLRQAADLGYQDGDHLHKTPTFEPLRGREEFKKLLVEMAEKKNKPQAR